MPLTREQVIDTAYGILRDFGLADLSMRRLARDLGVQPGALYWHVKNKQDLLGVLSVMILAPAGVEEVDGKVSRNSGGSGGSGPIGDGSGLSTGGVAASIEGIRQAAKDIRNALLAVRDGAEVVALTHALDPGALAALHSLAASFAGAGLPEAQAEWAGTALVHYILGTVTDEQTRAGLIDAGVLDGIVDASADAAAFAFGLDLLLEGCRTVSGQAG
ncbi:AcrR family transcriptional regulator [Arthrobacter silviterrae]|uniref:TetR family transcriptional regulator n=1 Tax=Arthrobacter silviterrae TaxID=2026658 RepID=A0ABX0DBQ7_9MICC|nr:MULTISPECIES: TetR/AcrR family transcriptional regulator C-terminal domain-containing protein [Arthrobacter]MCU6479993.1 TetR/AcrR family transcriptional regulator C-terminal domain-containing protein [Arthrobacter sp. A2-55]MDQ0276010.1 AcrR family transcriptional regulator [Arthrobacter silviterrae]NGN84357.1 TetR family transcriptional regulator [Arthrobacter silviterrae]